MQEELKSLWLTETIRLIEKDCGRFADQDINRQVRATQSSPSSKIIMRATILSKQNGLLSAQKILLNAIKLSFLLLSFVSIFLGASLAIGALSQNPVNLYWALFSLLGVHLITFTIWLASFFFFNNLGGSLLVYCWLWLAKKFSQKKTVQQLIPAFVTLFGGRIRWLIGLVLNLFWTVILWTALLVLIILLSTQHYSFEWKSTLLSSDMIIQLTHYLGILPAKLGFSMPNDDVIRFSEQALNAGDIRASWAVWLLGVFIVYGLGVRFLCMLICGIKWQVSSRQVQLDLSQPEYQILANELQPLLVNIEDEDKQQNKTNWRFATPIYGQGKESFLVAVEISEEWTPPDSIAFLGFLNSREQQKEILDYLQLTPAKKLLIAIDTDRIPDRGVLNLLNQLMNKSQQHRIWFINHGKQFDNWQALSLQLAQPEWLNEDL